MIKDNNQEQLMGKILDIRKGENSISNVHVLEELQHKAEGIHGKGRVELYELKAFLENAKDATTNIHEACNNCLAYINRIERNTNAVVMIVDQSRIEKIRGSDNLRIKSSLLPQRRLQSSHNICSKIDYGKQQSAFALGSGFFIGLEGEEMHPPVIATAGHVVINSRKGFGNLRFVTGIIPRNDNDFTDDIIVPKSSIVQPVAKKLKPSQYFASTLGADWALVEVRQSYPKAGKVAPESILLPKKTLLKKGTPLYGIGHGLGLPMKVSLGGTVIKTATQKSYFECNLPLLGGNSGSPVFNAETHELVGIHIRGMKMLELYTGDQNNKCFQLRKQKNSKTRKEGQECQHLYPIRSALEKIVETKYLVSVK